MKAGDYAEVWQVGDDDRISFGSSAEALEYHLETMQGNGVKLVYPHRVELVRSKFKRVEDPSELGSNLYSYIESLAEDRLEEMPKLTAEMYILEREFLSKLIQLLPPLWDFIRHDHVVFVRETEMDKFAEVKL
jgi:hypothetical protein